MWNAPDPFTEFVAQRYPNTDLVWKQEGAEATVSVHEFGAAPRRRRILTINGNHQAGDDFPTTFTHRRIGHLPMIIHPQARTALVIGLGGGATAGAVSIHEGVDVDVVELADAVVQGARWFEDINYNILSRPNVHVRVDDGRNYMMLTSRQYDVITADVVQPIFVGAGNIYSEEYFRLMRRVLKPGGKVLQWIPGTEAEYKLIARTFISVFPESTAWADGSLFLGSVEPLRLRRQDFDWKRDIPGHAQGLKDTQIESFEALLDTFAAGPDEIRAFVGPGPLLTDDRPVAEYFLSLPRDRSTDLASLRGDVKRFVVDE
jgi:spermidine synthase